MRAARWSRGLRRFAATVLPVPCLGCDGRDGPVCGRCEAALAAAPPGPAPPGVAAWASAFAYAGAARELVARIKYRDARAGVPWLAARMAEAAASLPLRAIDAVTWAPTTAARRRARGFDHAELLARAVGRELGLPARAALGRVDGPAQTGRNARERRVGPRFVARRSHGRVRWLVVDDVATTGATLARAADALTAGGGPAPCALTGARTAPPASPSTGSLVYSPR